MSANHGPFVFIASVIVGCLVLGVVLVIFFKDVLVVFPPLSVGKMTLRLYGALNYSPNSAHDLRYALNGA